MEKFLTIFLWILDVLLVPIVFSSAWPLKIIRCIGVNRLPLCKNVLLNIGVFPIRSHYYEPQFDNRALKIDLSLDRNLPGIDWNVSGQLSVLKTFKFSSEFMDMPHKKTNTLSFYFNNGMFESGDAEYWYQLIRAIKPKKIIEIGSGNSTLMAIKAIKKNVEDDKNYRCEHICIEPHEMPWLEKTGVFVIRKKVEDIELELFSKLEENDILFIDSSHIIKPQGDVLYEYLEILPILESGVIVHFHDIFTPKNYPKQWLEEKIIFWNEQYILEAVLQNNSSWEIYGALNYLHHKHYDKLKSIAPFLTPEREPGSFYIRKK